MALSKNLNLCVIRRKILMALGYHLLSDWQNPKVGPYTTSTMRKTGLLYFAGKRVYLWQRRIWRSNNRCIYPLAHNSILENLSYRCLHLYQLPWYKLIHYSIVHKRLETTPCWLNIPWYNHRMKYCIATKNKSSKSWYGAIARIHSG